MNARGFTIVELLIVIVVIAILAAITVVAYNGIQDRANDAIIKSDITAFAKKIKMYEVENERYPHGNGSSNAALQFTEFSFQPSKSSYSPTSVNLYYCEGLKSGQATFAITARSKSNKIFIYRPEEGITLAGGGNPPSNCYAGWDGGVFTSSMGYNPNINYLWSDWTNS